MTSIPSEQLAVLSTKESETLQTFPVPSPGPGEVLIKNVAVAANPKDWKVPLFLPDYSAIEGSDLAGYVVKVGEGVTEYKGGERVAAFTKIFTGDSKYGAYAQYTVAPVATTFPIPESISFEDAATLPLAVGTAFLGLFVRLGLLETPSGEQKGIIINGASSSVGSYAVQLAKRAGLFVIGVAGSAKDYASSLGADVIIDYREHSGDALEKALVEAATGKNVQWAYDAIAESGSVVLLSRVLAKVSPTGKGGITFTLPVSDEDRQKIPEGFQLSHTFVASAYGEDSEFSARFYRQIGQWLSSSPPFQPNRAKVLPDGLVSVPKALQLLKTGQVHGEKFVYRIADTPGLK